MNARAPNLTINSNLRVSEQERRDFEAWCAQNRLSQVDAFREVFRLLREHHPGPDQESDQ
jgi:hypothetical protein